MKFITRISFAMPWILSCAPFVARAADLTLQPVPGTNNTSPAGYVAGFYNFAFAISGLLAFSMIIYGAVKYTISAGNPSQQGDARDIITQAFLGLLLIFGAALILNLINPVAFTLNGSQFQLHNPPKFR